MFRACGNDSFESNHVGVLMDNAAGEYTIDTIYDDANPEQMESLPDTQLHRNVDLELLKADKEGASLPPPLFFFGSNYLLAYIIYYQVMSRFTSSYPLRSMGWLAVHWLTSGSRTLILLKSLCLSR